MAGVYDSLTGQNGVDRNDQKSLAAIKHRESDLVQGRIEVSRRMLVARQGHLISHQVITTN